METTLVLAHSIDNFGSLILSFDKICNDVVNEGKK
jgi:hypothetical protein